MSFKLWLNQNYTERGPIKLIAFSLEAISALTLFSLMLLTCADVVGRYFFNNSVDGTTELTEIAIAVMIFAVLPVITWRGGHVVVDILDDYLNDKIIKVLSLLAAFIISSTLYFLGLRIYQIAARSLRREEVTEYLELPVGYIVQYIATMSWITAAMMISYGVYLIIKNEKQ
ncbi:MAG: TRAP transporter small permease [Pseudomonadales bacterium]|nr:TRAP transporter small permease [Pseudomonadales bacterium]NRA17747.1 TRAP transporter small permease [Oceanospirillaceae bacterium]